MTRIGVRIRPRASETMIRKAVEAAGGVYEPPVKRKKRKDEEHVFQVQIKKHMTPLVGGPGILSPLGTWWCSLDTPHNRPRVNEYTGNTFDLDGQRRKAKGCVRNVSDTVWFWGRDREGGWIELKDETDTNDGQDDFLSAMRFLGFHTAVVWKREGVERVESLLRGWGMPMRGRSMFSK